MTAQTIAHIDARPYAAAMASVVIEQTPKRTQSLLDSIEQLEGWRLFAFFALIAIVARWQTFGNPVGGFDEQFYLVMGDRMLQGALPYVDIFDRKPIGLFLIFGFIRLLGGEGTIQTQIIACLFVIATAMLIHRLARRIAPPGAALAAGVAYIFWLNFLEGEGSQAPVFFNLTMIAAALVVARAWRNRGANLAALGTAAMLLAGIAIQIKYTALFEGIFFGLALMWTGWRAGISPVRLIALGALWVAVALLPTAVALVTYVAMGHGQEFFFANFVSMFGKQGDSAATSREGLATMAAILSPLLGLAAFPPPATSPEELSERRFVQLWLFAAIAGLLIFGSFPTPQYAMPLLVPVVIAAAPRLGLGNGIKTFRWVMLICALVAGQIVIGALIHNKGGRAEAAAITAAAMPRHGGCIFVYDGYPALYRLTHSCLLSRYVFPGHLNMENEDSIKALGVDASDEVERIMQAGPETVIDDWPTFEFGNHVAHATVVRYLARDYHLVLRLPTGANRFRLVYRRNETGSISTGRM
ncbi:hypothetical protein D3Y57_09095 [Sphingomonas paeninsulae]|uniref:Uncharacterized protein n=1 Tax=Sphingomonas paeninsulae TaxID=2319844 RepID=A0A494TFP1_SPHPE|nr:glycosyltransferase family 39 protein [Sphingomonas paeninsulae]AYJ86092.1 hypothetical protein D3Y57_09095 [Sphingomonas paeninsulae]